MIIEREKPLKSNLNRNYWIVQNGRHQDLQDVTGWSILVAADVENKTDAELQSIIDEYEALRIGEEFIKAVHDYEGHYYYKDGMPCLDEDTMIFSKRNLEDDLADGTWGEFKIKPWVKDGDIFIANYTKENYGCFKVEKAEDVVNYLKGNRELLKESEYPTED